MSQTVSMMGSNGHNGRNIQQSEHLTRIIPVEVPAYVLEDDPGGVHVAVRVHRLGVARVSAVRHIVPRDMTMFSTSTILALSMSKLDNAADLIFSLPGSAKL